mgnify:CR=1 FL=1
MGSNGLVTTPAAPAAGSSAAPAKEAPKAHAGEDALSAIASETEPTVKGQTAASSYKPAILSNGVRTQVPPHIAAGTRVVDAHIYDVQYTPGSGARAGSRHDAMKTFDGAAARTIRLIVCVVVLLAAAGATAAEALTAAIG